MFYIVLELYETAHKNIPRAIMDTDPELSSDVDETKQSQKPKRSRRQSTPIASDSDSNHSLEPSYPTAPKQGKRIIIYYYILKVVTHCF